MPEFNKMRQDIDKMMSLVTSLQYNGSCTETRSRDYEEIKLTAHYGGIFDYDVPILDGMIITRIGNIVFCKIRAYTARIQNHSNLIISKIPEQFVPDSTISYQIQVLNNDVHEEGTALVNPDGLIKISQNAIGTSHIGNGIKSYRVFGYSLSVGGTYKQICLDKSVCGLPHDIELIWQITSKNNTTNVTPLISFNPTIAPEKKYVDNTISDLVIDSTNLVMTVKNDCCMCFGKINDKYVMIPCGHARTCISCANMLNNCPLCRKNIEKVIKVFD